MTKRSKTHLQTMKKKHLRRFKEICIKLYEELRTQGTHYLCTLIVFNPEKWLGSKLGKLNLKKISIKLYEELRTQGTHRLCTLIVFKPENASSNPRKSDKNEFEDNIQTICTSSDHAKTPRKFSKDLVKTVGVVVVTHRSTVARIVMCRQDSRGRFPVLLDDLYKCRTNSQRKSQLS